MISPFLFNGFKIKNPIEDMFDVNENHFCIYTDKAVYNIYKV